MWKYLTLDKYNEILLSFNLVNTSNIKEVNKILYNISNNIDVNYEEIIIHKKNRWFKVFKCSWKNFKKHSKTYTKKCFRRKENFKIFLCLYKRLLYYR